MPWPCIRRIPLALAVGASFVILAATAGPSRSQTQSQTQTQTEVQDQRAVQEAERQGICQEVRDRIPGELRPPARDRRGAGAEAGDGGGRRRRGHRAIYPAVRREGRAEGEGLRRGHRAAVPRAHRRRRQEARAEPGRHGPRRSGLDEPAGGVGRRGVPERRVSSPGEAGEGAGLDPSGAPARRPAGRRRVRPGRGPQRRRSCSSTSAPARRSFERKSRTRDSASIPTPNPPKLKENFFLRFEKTRSGLETGMQRDGCDPEATPARQTGTGRWPRRGLGTLIPLGVRPSERARRRLAPRAPCSRPRRTPGPPRRARTAPLPPGHWPDGPTARANPPASRPPRRDRPADGTPGAGRLSPRAADGQRRWSATDPPPSPTPPRLGPGVSSSPNIMESRPWTHRTRGPPRPRFRVRRSLTSLSPRLFPGAFLQTPYTSMPVSSNSLFDGQIASVYSFS